LAAEAKIEGILSNFKGLRSISEIKTMKKRTLVTHMVDKEGHVHTDRASIADIFADFYEELYASKYSDEVGAASNDNNHTAIPPFTRAELDEQLRSLKNGRAKDSSSIIAEMLKQGGETLTSVLLSLYNQIITPGTSPPAIWKQSIVMVLHKSGGTELPQNYRPITIIPLLYKLFAKLLHHRLYHILDKRQCQAGFRKGMSTSHHLSAITFVQEKAYEWQQNIWFAAIDFKKAFDMIEHDSLWDALMKQGVPNVYVELLQQLYKGQSARVRLDSMSKPFHIGRGTKQGDPLSSLFFNALLEDIMAEVKEVWQEKGMGVHLGYTSLSCMTNLRFADDILLTATSLSQLKKMLSHLGVAASSRGLELHPDKTKILTNATRKTGRPKESTIIIGGMEIEILPSSGATKYLGRQLSFDIPHETELRNRIAAAWRKFMTLKDELTGKCYSLSGRLRLFDSTVSATMLYGCAVWNLTKDMQRRVQGTQRKMLRMIVGSGRRREQNNEVESWVEWIKRTTHKAEELLKRHNLDDWITTYKRRKFMWARELATKGQCTWAFKALMWQPDECTHRRKQARPRQRWIDDIATLIQEAGFLEPWNVVAESLETWEQLLTCFIK
jgi:hypothetical protein